MMTPPIKKLVSPETLQKFKIYERLLREWNSRTTLVQEDTLSDFDNRHVLDSLQLIPIISCIQSQTSFLNPGGSFLPHFETMQNSWKKLDEASPLKDNVSIMDVGTGAGFPGMVLAMCGFKKVNLCDSNQKKCFFLEEVARQTKTQVSIRNIRIENVAEKFNILLSRACSPLDGLCGMMSIVSSDASSYGLFHKGRSWQEEVAAAQKRWKFSSGFTKSVTSKDGVVLYLRHLERRETFKT
jgi:16S rRNA (guanine527-N7)-methyltransferase